MHGNEVAGRVILFQLIDYLLTNSSNDESVAFILSNTRVHIMPTMNPDGFEESILGECMTVNGLFKNKRIVNRRENFANIVIF